MRISETLWNTWREAPAGITLPGQQFLARAGLIRSPAPAVWSYLPLGQAVWERLRAAIASIAEAEGAEAVSLPWARPAESRSGQVVRWREGEDPLWAAWDLAEKEFRSYRHLPRLVYSLVPRLEKGGVARAGLLGSAMTRQLAVFGFHLAVEPARQKNHALRERFVALLSRLGVAPLLALAGPHEARAWLFENPEGNVSALRCASCGWVALPHATVIAPPPAETAEMLPPQEVETPDCTTIAALADFLGIPASKTMKVVFYTVAEERVLCAVIRGDLDIDEGKLAAALEGQPFRLSTDSEVRWAGSVPGYGSPIGLRSVMVWADPTVMAARNLVAGANREPYHLLNVNAGRDFRVDRVVDMRAARAGDPCPSCGGELSEVHAFELGYDHILPAGSLGQPAASYLDEGGQGQPIVLSRVCLDVDRTLAATAEANHDAEGLCWPAAIAPAHVHLLAIRLKADAAVAEVAERLYRRLQDEGYSVVYDDRDERPGVAFKDADLLGLPLRLTVSQRSLEAGGIEAKWRTQTERFIVSEEKITDLLRQSP